MSWISDVKHDLSKLDLSIKSLKKFGITVGIVFLLICGWFYFRESSPVIIYIFLAAGLSLLIAGLLVPAKLDTAYKIWMGLAFVLGWLVSRVILTVLFFLVIFPIGIIAKISGKKFLEDSIDKKAETYWVKKDNAHINYEKMF